MVEFEETGITKTQNDSTVLFSCHAIEFRISSFVRNENCGGKEDRKKFQQYSGQ